MAKRIVLVGAAWLRGWFGAVAACAVALAGCGDKDGSCEAGTENCACVKSKKGDTCISGDLFCAAGTCRKISCVPGELNCSCFTNMTCSKNADGEALVCNRGLCSEPSCEQGASGCGCYPNSTCNTGLDCVAEGDALVCMPPVCTAGENGCACLADGTCTGTTLACVNGKCSEPVCVLGSVGCDCQTDGSCSAGLQCSASNKCVSDVCAGKDGDTGCQCKTGDICNDAKATCSETKICVLTGCTQGTETCGCLPKSACTGNAANGKPLVCDAGTCVPAPCLVGEKGCGCNPDQTCNTGLACDATTRVCAEICVAGSLGCKCLANKTCNDITLACGTDGLCAKSNCVAGTLACQCLADQTCGNDADGTALTCVEKTCQNCRKTVCATPGLAVPKLAYCYSPCKSGFTDGTGVYHACEADGLMRHQPGKACFEVSKDNVKTCQQGSCLGTSDKLPTCKTDIDCADFQNCVDGRCYATCDSNGDCPSGLNCYRHACRAPCSAADQTCAERSSCVLTDGVSGFCMPMGSPPSSAVAGPVLGTFQLSTESIEFNSGHIDATITLTNVGSLAAKFKVKKLEHTENGGAKRDTATPLHWLKMGAPGQETAASEFSITVDPATPGIISLKGAANSTLPRWQGVIEIRSENLRLGARKVNLSYVGSVDGRWAGTVYYFANFGTEKLDPWISDRESACTSGTTDCAASKNGNVGNALIRHWGNFRYGGATKELFDAAVQSAITRSWDWKTVRDACKKRFPAVQSPVCFPYAADGSVTDGVELFTSAPSAYPIPTGVTELPVAFDLQASSTNLAQYVGLIPTAEALHYPGNSTLNLTFEAAPTSATCPHAWNGSCVVFAKTLDATVAIGGRYLLPGVGAEDVCATGWKQVDVPWLVPGFNSWTGENAADGLLYRRECRDPAAAGATAAQIASRVALAGANPIADGRTRSRRLKLIDGAMFDQDSLILFVKESFDSFLGAGDTSEFAVYSVMKLNRTPAQLTTFEGMKPPTATALAAEPARALSCPSALLKDLGFPDGVTATNAKSVAGAILNGLTPTGGAATLDHDAVHYLCHETGRIDGGNTAANGGANYDCPVSSNATFFYFRGVSPILDAAAVAALPCQRDGTCQQTLTSWRTNGPGDISPEPPIIVCTDPNEGLCSANRGDLRVGKTFYIAGEGGPVVTPLRTAINEAFRYKTQFRTRKGGTVGFAPEPCVPNSSAVPYCYDAAQIQEARDRVDCALHLYHNYSGVRDTLRQYLIFNFSYQQTLKPPIYSYDGFEVMLAELLVMLGDDAYTASFASRFDLAESNKVSFQGALFEPSGINLSGVAGYEMYRLYQAVQYYGVLLDRFYQLIPYMTTATGTFEDFITQEDEAGATSLPASTFASYFPKLVRASAQKTRAWSEIAKRYQSFNRPELARLVIERAYNSAYIELAVMRNLVTRYIGAAKPENKAQVVDSLRTSSLTYGAALFDMRDVYQRITDDVSFFGFAPDYMPFPALDPADVNAFTKLLALARQRVSVAAEKEQLALSSNRAYETDAASFQAELVKLRINYDNQLADICGTMDGTDGLKYPAISRYAYLNTKASTLGDPCGLMDTGRLYTAMGELENLEIDMKRVLGKFDTLFSDIEIEKAQALERCAKTNAIAVAKYKLAGATIALQDDINLAQKERSRIADTIQTLDRARSAASCFKHPTGADCGVNAIALLVFEAAAIPMQSRDLSLQKEIEQRTKQIAEAQAAEGLWEGLQDCELTKIDSNARIKSQLLAVRDIRLEAVQALYRVRLAFSTIQQYRDQSKRIANEMQEMEEQTINIEAARNDPNIRIYKNDSIINADRTFESALAAAYQATKVFEYYTSQTYGRLDQLFLVRMVSHGDYNLENYLSELEDAYLAFQQAFGNPDERVDILSLRDDIFQIPRLGSNGAAVSQSARISELRAKLTDVALLDEQGYLTVPFATSVARLSPLTRNHKIKRIEAEVVGSSVGDPIGRVYLRQKGTGIVRSVGDEKIYYRFPELAAVINPFFNGVRSLDGATYSSARLRDRPYANSRWDLVLNQKDETANMDIDLNSVTDIRLYLYYTDFTAQ